MFFLFTCVMLENLNAAERTVVFELFLSPCLYCVNASMSEYELAQKYNDKFLLLEYDAGGPLKNESSVARSLGTRTMKDHMHYLTVLRNN